MGIPIAYENAVVGELWVDGEVECDELEQIAVLIAPYVLIGWDTDGEAWDPCDPIRSIPRSRERHSIESGTSFEGLNPSKG